MKTLIRTAAVAVAAAGFPSVVSPVSAHVSQTAEGAEGGRLASAPFGLSLEDLRVGLSGKVSSEVGSTEVPVRIATDIKCRTNSNCK